MAMEKSGTPVYFVLFPKDSPVFTLLPEQCALEGVFQDITEAEAYFCQLGSMDDPGKPEGCAEMPTTCGIILVNGIAYYRRGKAGKVTDEDLLRQLVALREASGGMRLALLLPEGKNTDQELLVDLMSRGFNDFWFLSSLDKHMLETVLRTSRDFREMEAYLDTLPRPIIADKDTKAAHKTRSPWGQSQGKIKPWTNMLDRFMHSVDNVLQSVEEDDDYRRGFPEAIAPNWDEDGAMQDEPAPGWDADGAMQDGPAPGWDADAPAPDEPAPGWDLEDAPVLDRTYPGIAIDLSTSARHALRGFSKYIQKKSVAKVPAETLPTHASLLFYSSEDCLLTYALSFLTATYLACAGAKTLLVELPGSGSRLGVTLGLRHPERNLRRALLGFAEGAETWKKSCFTGPSLYRDPMAIDRTRLSKHMPAQLYVLPDLCTEEDLHTHWESFLASLVQWAVLEERFTYLLYVCFGGDQAAYWHEKVAYMQKIEAYSPRPGGFNATPDQAWARPGACITAIDGSWGARYIQKELKASRIKDFLLVPAAIKVDFLEMATFTRDAGQFSQESRQCLQDLCARLSSGRASSTRGRKSL